jgi:hypothetical protein
MYRMRSVIKVTHEGWPSAIENVARMNELARKRGWQQATVWTQAFGPYNELSIELEYPDLATYEREAAAFGADDEAMNLRHDAVKYRRGGDSGYSDVWERVDDDG